MIEGDLRRQAARDAAAIVQACIAFGKPSLAKVYLESGLHAAAVVRDLEADARHAARERRLAREVIAAADLQPAGLLPLLPEAEARPCQGADADPSRIWDAVLRSSGFLRKK